MKELQMLLDDCNTLNAIANCLECEGRSGFAEALISIQKDIIRLVKEFEKYDLRN